MTKKNKIKKNTKTSNKNSLITLMGSKKLKRKNLVVALLVVGLILIFYFITIIRIGAGVDKLL